jgi:hypothetical protein
MTSIGRIIRIAAVAAAFGLIFGAAAPAPAQPSLERPRTSQRASVMQRVGITDITVVYHRPGVKGREIWGALVPYGQVWRTGANEVTTISFSDPVTVGGTPMPAGTYGLFTLPGPSSWTLILSSNTTTWGTVYDSTRDVLRVEMKPEASGFTEWMTFGFTGLSDTGATLELRWEKLTVPVRIGVATAEIVLDRARKEFSAGADSTRWQMLRQAAAYAASRNLHTDEALAWIDRSLAVDRNFQSLCVKADILDLTGDAAGAGTTMDEAIAGAKENEVTSYALQLRRDDRAARAVSVLGMYAARHGGSWSVSRALGESYDAAGDRAKALQHLGDALAKAPGGPEKEEIGKLIQTINQRK